MNTFVFYLPGIAETEVLGQLLGRRARPGDIICLDGDLGAGKTTLTQAIGRGLGVAEGCYITSPSFAILHEYEGRIPMFHMDFYRLQGAEEVEDLGFEEYFYFEGLTVIEWSKRAVEVLPEVRMSFEIVLREDLGRTVTLQYSPQFTETVICIKELFS
ncbi:MAG: tRNA (adenosine(37)-N6)-threonylcarbamoyltransferase complex ATPase subunit type 1 TsaE [Desulforhopalus sp.]